MMEYLKTARIIPFEGPRELATVTAKLPVLFLPEPKASERFWEFFTANIRNKNTRRAYYESRGLDDLARVGEHFKPGARKSRGVVHLIG
jgi:hypothetical protein